MTQILRRPRQGPRSLWQNAPKTLRRVFLLGASLIVVGASGFAWWAWREPDPRRAYTRAAAIVSGRVELRETADTTWAHAMADGRRRLAENDTLVLKEQWIPFVKPRFPPLLCVNPDTNTPVGPETIRLASTLERLASGTLGDDPADGENRAVAALQEYIESGNTADRSFFHSFNAANAALRLGRMPWAVEFLSRLQPTLDELPSLGRGPAASYRRQRGLNDPDIARVFLARYLGGLIQLERTGVGEEAISLFRLAINTFNYLTGSVDSHAREIAMPAYSAWACDEREFDDLLTSLDAYSGLVTAYLLTEGYSHSDPGALADEVERRPADREPDDPFGALLSYAASVAEDPAASAIPENFLWAASNIQTVRQHNLLGPPVRLEVARAALALQVVSRPTWVTALETTQGMVPCTFLERILDDLALAGRDLWGLDPGTVSEDKKALAAVSVYVAAAIEEQCGRPADITVEARTGLLTAGTPHLLDPIPGLYEGRRLRLERSVSEDAAEATMDSVEVELADLESGRVPELYRGSDRSVSINFVRRWRRAVFRDLTDGLAALGEEKLRTSRGSAEGDSLLRALENVTRLAAVRPREIYRAPRLAALATGQWSAGSFRVRSFSREYPLPVTVGLILVTALIIVVFFWTVLGVWLWDLVSGEGYTREKTQRTVDPEERMEVTAG